MPLDHSPILDAAAGEDAPEFRPHRTLNAQGFPCETSWRLLGDVVNKVISDAERNCVKRKGP
jgi:hypothetical protein